MVDWHHSRKGMDRRRGRAQRASATRMDTQQVLWRRICFVILDGRLIVFRPCHPITQECFYAYWFRGRTWAKQHLVGLFSSVETDGTNHPFLTTNVTKTASRITQLRQNKRHKAHNKKQGKTTKKLFLGENRWAGWWLLR